MSGRARLEAFLDRVGCPDAAVERLVQDAGERIYYRIRPSSPVAAVDDPGRGTFVACVMAAPYAPGALPFADSTALYDRLGVRTPRMGTEAPELGVLALEDLGDFLLQTVARAGDPRTAALYHEAIAILGAIQGRGAEIGSSAEASRYRAFGMRLDEALFRRELRFFVEHFVEPARRSAPWEFEAVELDRRLGSLAAEAAATPQALCHRDYHSRNLMVRSGLGLSVIDHQDTRLGPRLYDLASLLRDPYVAGPGPGFAFPFGEADLLARFVAATGLAADPDELAREFDTVALQRGLKALGTYGFQVHRRGNPVYRAFIAPTLALVRENLERWPRRRPLRESLAGMFRTGL